MGFMKPKTVAPPDPYEVADAQNSQNLYASMVNLAQNRIDQTSPYGSVTYENDGYYQVSDDGRMMRVDEAPEVDDGNAYIPIDVQKTELSPVQQQILDSQQEGTLNNVNLSNQLQDNIVDSYSTDPRAALDNVDPRTQAIDGNVNLNKDLNLNRLDYSNLSDQPDALSLENYAEYGLTPLEVDDFNSDDFSEDRRRVEEATMSRMRPQLDRSYDRLRQDMANQGIVAGSDAYNEQMDSFTRQENDAIMQSILAGGGEQSRMMGLQNMNYGQQADAFSRNQALQSQSFNQQSQNRQQEFNEYNNLQQYNNNLTAQEAGFSNDAIQNELLNNLRAGQFNDGLRRNDLKEELYFNDMPLNRFNALRTGSNVQQPSFTPFYQSSVNPANIADYMYTSYDQQVANANAQAAGKQQLVNGMIQLGGRAAMMGAGGNAKY